MKTKQKRAYTRKPKEPGTALTVKTDNQTQIVPADANSLIALAMDKNLDADKMQKLIDMKHAEEDRAAKREFDIHFAAMQAELPIIRRTKKSHTNTYAPIDEMVTICKPVTSKHGFAFYWDRKPLNEKQAEIIFIVSGWGWEKRNSMIVIIDEPIKSRGGDVVTNRNQMNGASDTYGHRYTMKAGLGLVEADEDTDGNYRTVDQAYETNTAHNGTQPRNVTEKKIEATVRKVTPEKTDQLKSAADEHKEAYRKRLQEVAGILLAPPFTDDDKKAAKEVLNEASKTQNMDSLDKYEKYLIEEVAFKRGYTKWDAEKRILIKAGAK